MLYCLYHSNIISDDGIPEYQNVKIMVLSRVMRKIVCRQLKEALLCNGGVAESGPDH